MPEVMAMMKLKGFVSDLGGEVIESVPGLIKVRLREEKQEEKKAGGFLGWMSNSGSRQVKVLLSPQGIDIELHMERRDPAQVNKLTITLVMRPPAGGLATTEWKNRCNQINRDLQAYLMGR
jgi:serine/threonine-protein kinase